MPQADFHSFKAIIGALLPCTESRAFLSITSPFGLMTSKSGIPLTPYFFESSLRNHKLFMSPNEQKQILLCILLDKCITVRNVIPVSVRFFQIFNLCFFATIGGNKNNLERLSAQFVVEIL